MTLDFGPTWSFRYPTVNDVIARQAPVSLELGLLAFLWVVALGVPFGVISAVWSGGAAVLGLTVVLTVTIVLANLLVDLLHGALDPRVRESRAGA